MTASTKDEFSYFILHKPFGVMCQFSPMEGKKVLSQIIKVPKDVYPIGRLDENSEGLLLLTNDKSLNNKLLHPSKAHERTYWAQVEGLCTPEKLEPLTKGLDLSFEGKKYTTLPCKAFVLSEEPKIAPRNPPIRYRASIPTTWISITLIEGKNHQVRKMTAKIGFPTLRLIRVAIEQVTLENLNPGELKAYSKKELYNLLHIPENSKK